MQDITHVDVVLENCDTFRIPKERIITIDFLDIKERVRVSGSGVVTTKTANEISVGLFYTTDTRIKTEFTDGCMENYPTMGEILNRKDISQIHLMDGIKTVDWFFVGWRGEYYSNERQHYFVDDAGFCPNIQLYIGEDGEGFTRMYKNIVASRGNYNEFIEDIATKLSEKYDMSADDLVEDIKVSDRCSLWPCNIERDVENPDLEVLLGSKGITHDDIEEVNKRLLHRR